MELKKNVAYSVILTLSTYLVPLFVYPYISRVLGPGGIGQVDDVDSIIDYCILFSMLGLTTIGIREIARNRSDAQKLQKTFSSLFTINMASTAVVMTVLGVLVMTVPVMNDRWQMFLIGMTKIISNLFWIEWFFKGMEDFRYITIRSVLLRLIFVASVFIFVRESDDVMTYYILWVGLTFCNAVCNWTYRRRFVKLSFRELQVREFFKPVLVIGLFAVFSAVYTKLNIFYLGSRCGDTQVGFYTTATRLYSVLMALFTSITGVMIPRMSVLVSENKMDVVRSLTDKTFRLLFLFAIPVLIFFEFFAPEFIMLLTGMDFSFSGAVVPMRIVMCQLLVIGTEQILILQLLIPSGRDRQAVACAVVGALVCALVNAILLPSWGCIGSAIAWVSAELSVLAVAMVLVRKYVKISFPLMLFFRYLLLSLPYVVAGTGCLLLVHQPLLRLLFGSLTFGVWFIVLGYKEYNSYLRR